MYLSIKILDYITFLYYIVLQSALQKEFSSLSSLILFKLCHLGIIHRCGDKKIPFPNTVKLGTVIPYLMKILKINESRDAHVEFCCLKHFLPEINKFWYVKKYRYRLHFDT